MTAAIRRARQLLAEEEYGADGGEQRRGEADRSDLGDRYARHREEPQHHAARVHHAAQHVQTEPARDQMDPQRAIEERKHEAEPDHVAQERGLHRGEVASEVADDSGHRDEEQTRHQHPADRIRPRSSRHEHQLTWDSFEDTRKECVNDWG